MSKPNFGMYPQGVYNFVDKEKSVGQTISYMLNRLLSMFEYKGLPDTIPKRILELYLLTKGHCAFTDINDNLYCVWGGLGGELDYNFMPTLYTYANPYLKVSKSAKIGEDCIVIPNDSLYIGLLPLCIKYATALTENEISLDIAVVNSRITDLISADNDTARQSAEIYLDNIRKGKQGVIGSTAFLEGIKSQPYGAVGTHTITDLIENEQYLKASWYNEVGLQSNYNMKRESINSNESQLNEDMLLPLIDDMIANRKEAIDKINKKYGTNISLDFSSSWKNNKVEIEQTLSERSETNEDGGTNNEQTL